MKRLLLLALALPLFAQSQYTMSPSRGPVAGGTAVTIKGTFGQWPYGVIFGGTSVPATRVDDHTLVATTPAHLPGIVTVTIFEYDIGISTDLSFTFEGKPEDAFDRLLLPVFTPPIRGAFGSEFRTDFQMALALGGMPTDVYGLGEAGEAVRVSYSPRIIAPNVRNGTPGRLLYVPKNSTKNLVMSLRAYDVSRSTDDFGTQIPIVPRSGFATDGHQSTVGIIGIPSDPRFRNTLRIYGAGEFSAGLNVEVWGEGYSKDHKVELRGTGSPYDPWYAEFTDFPVNVGALQVWITLSLPPISALQPSPDLWAFVSVTNNETQHITTITPRP